MKQNHLYFLTELAEGLVEYEGADLVDGRVSPNSDVEDIKSMLRDNLEAVIESEDVDPVDTFGAQYSGDHIAHELEPHGEVFYFDYPGGRIEVSSDNAQSRSKLPLLKLLSEGRDIYQAIDIHYSDPMTPERARMDIEPALDDDGYLKPEYQEELEQIMDMRREKGMEPFNDSSGDP